MDHTFNSLDYSTYVVNQLTDINTALASSTPGVMVSWDLLQNNNIGYFEILRSNSFLGDYEIISIVDYPTNYFIDTTGNPTNFYKIRSVDKVNSVVLSTSTPLSADELLLSQSLYVQIQALMDVRVHSEVAKLNRDRTVAILTYKNWLTYPKPEVQISGLNEFGDPFIILDDVESIKSTIQNSNNYPNGLKWKADWNNRIYFINDNDVPQPIDASDEINVSYHVKLFKNQELRVAMQWALGYINSIPGTNKYQNISNLPLGYDSIIVLGAYYWLMKALYTRMLNQEERLLISGYFEAFGESTDPISYLQEILKGTEESFKEEAKNLAKLRYPNTKIIITPHYILPGGRSRMFRYMWKGGGLG